MKSEEGWSWVGILAVISLIAIIILEAGLVIVFLFLKPAAGSFPLQMGMLILIVLMIYYFLVIAGMWALGFLMRFLVKRELYWIANTIAAAGLIISFIWLLKWGIKGISSVSQLLSFQFIAIYGWLIIIVIYFIVSLVLINQVLSIGMEKKMILWIIGILILVLVIVLVIQGYTYWQEQKSEIGTGTEVKITGTEWFQAGNIQDINKIQTKKSEELEDNRMGGLWSLKIPDLYGDPDEFFHDINDLGLKWIRVDIDQRDWKDVNWDNEEYSKYQIESHQDKTITGLFEKKVKMVYCLVFWDPEGPSFKEEEEQDYSRFRTEDEIERYLDYTRFIVHNFKDRIEYYEILNEPDIAEGTQQHVEVEDYINLVKRVIPVIREEQPEAKIIVGAVSNLNDPNSREYLFSLLKSDIMPLVDGISFHPMYGDASPQYDKEYYNNYPSLMQEIKDTAAAYGFKGEFIADELNYRTLENPLADEPWTYSDIVSAKYYARGTIINLGLDLTVGLCEMQPGNYDLTRMRAVRNLATVMAGTKPINLPIEIESRATNIKSYSFSLSNGDKLIALWIEGIVVDNHPGMNATLNIKSLTSEDVTGIDVLAGWEQPLTIAPETGSLIIENLIVRDYPLIIKIKKEV